jgi:kynurenine 3-monooxygenase
MEPTFGARPVVVAGAGLAGALAACYLRRKGFNVHVFERRPDPRKAGAAGGRSINLAISERGITAIKGIGLLDDILNITIPMFGRQIHALGLFSTLI